MSAKIIVTVSQAAEMIHGRSSVVVRMLREAGLVKMAPGLGERVCVPHMLEWWASLGQEAAAPSPAAITPPVQVRTDIRTGGLGLGKPARTG